MASLNFGVKAGNSIAYVEMFGMKTGTIYTMSTDNEKLEIPWSKRKNEAVNVAGYKKHFIRLSDEGVEEFITPYDAIEYLVENLKEVSGKVRVSGNVEKEPYVTKNGDRKFITKYIAQNITAVSDDEKPGLKLNMDLYYNKDSIDKSDFKSEKIITVNGYIRQYLRNSKSVVKAVGEMGREVFMPQQVVLSAAKLDLDNEKHQALFTTRTDELNVPSSKKMYHCYWECSLVSGAEEVEFDESQLTAKQKRLVELGVREPSDFAPKGGIYGPRIQEIRLITPNLINDCVDGVTEADITIREFEDEIVRFIEPEKFADVVEKSNKDEDEAPAPFELDLSDDDDDDDDDLFGGN